MSDTELQDGIEAATARFDRAIARLDNSVKGLNGRMRQLNRIEVDTQRLVTERSRLASELDKASARAKRLAANERLGDNENAFVGGLRLWECPAHPLRITPKKPSPRPAGARRQ